MKKKDEADKSETALKEEEVLKFWQENKIFEKSLAKPAPNGEFVFYDGPPFATGSPHYGHIVASVIKDVVPRYWTMRGYRVPRIWGWDCHGLPIENIVEKELGFKHKKDIKEYGIDKFNERCREQVLTYAHEWEKIIPRIGRWVDMEHAYKTMDKSFMESVWWVFKQLYDNNLVYEDYRSMHICPRCETTLSQQEVAEGYKDIKDISITVKLELKEEPKTYMLAWTTTPWTLPGNVALAVGEEMVYLKVKDGEEYFILAKASFEHYQKEFKKPEIVGEIKSSDLIGKWYKPLFDYYEKDKSLKNWENGWKVYAADFVTAEAGTGIVHVAPAFGEDDMNLGREKKLPFIQHVAMDGIFKPEVVDFIGMSVKPIEDPLTTDVKIIKFLAKEEKIFSKEKIEHSYPHCWRCDTPLLNYATSSWFVSVTKIKPELLKNAENINWSPSHIKEGRFGKWLEGARDWSISRQRFWASVIPVWVCGSCKKQKVFGSAADLEKESGTKVENLHKHVVDKISVKCECGEMMHRVPDVLDTWFDSGSMPYGQAHYPFENKEKFETSFPAKFIGEGLDQTRAWFYYLHTLAGALFNKNAFQNVIVNGIVLAEDGQKMSKKLKNYPDPSYVVDKYGADALRYYLLSSPVVRAEDLAFSEKSLDEVYKKMILRLGNVLSFFEMYKNEKNISASDKSENILDEWIICKFRELTNSVSNSLDRYELDKAARPISNFVDDLSTWYLRRSRERFKSENKEDKEMAIGATKFVLKEFSKCIAPFVPFAAERIYQKVKEENDPESVHLCNFPEAGEIDEEVLDKMEEARRIVSLALEKRMAAGIKVRQPLNKLKVKSEKLKVEKDYLQLIKDEVNIKEIEFNEKLEDEVELDTEITEELRREGEVREIIRTIQDLRKEKKLTPDQKIKIKISAPAETIELVKSAQANIVKPTNITEIELKIEPACRQGGNSKLKIEIA